MDDDSREMQEFGIDELDEVAGGCGRSRNSFFSCQCPPQQNNNNDLLMIMMMQMMMQDPRSRRRR
jgi:hypothetical protein